MIKLIGLVALVVFTAGCESGSTNSVVSAEVNWEEFAVTKVEISRSHRLGSINPALFGVVDQPDEVALLAEGFRSATKMEGKLDIGKADLDLVFLGEGERQAFHLWLQPNPESKAMYTLASDTGTGYTLSEEAANELRDRIYALPYTPEQAAKNGEIVEMYGKYRNEDKWVKFVDHVNKGTPDEVHLTFYTLEGAPLFRDFVYDGQAIEFTYDRAWDSYGGNSIRKTTAFCQGIEKKGAKYVLSGCDREDMAPYFDGFYLSK
ncbi:DUF4362 domain-containing protein [Cohnella mopanensis]|uniref:DUF4362 domain-containing protein n=1 Tax=Cohnella mopanensis TaxID=2911966 RepID=UPI001EF78E5B|nr:DUF4362 domain-containing protein [Cohnella mopanensis]